MNSPTSPTGSPKLQSKKSIVSYFGSLLGRKAGHINEWYIEFDEHSRVYNPGETLKGTLVVDVAKPMGVTHISISLFGYLEVFKNHSRQPTEHRDNVAPVASGKGRRWVSEYYGDGFASLFEDEIVLCGQGRLDPKLYHFRFELNFPSQLKLPSSIWFERGTVRYVVSATITRPAAMSTTITTSRKVDFKESIDVGELPPTKPRLVTLERVEKSNRSRIIRSLPNDSGNVCPPSPTSSRGEQASQTTATGRNTSGSRAPTPTSPSTRSSMSMPNVHAHESALAADSRSSRTGYSSRMDNTASLGSSRGDSGRNITASVQLSRAGCLPGETMHVTVNVQHTKFVRSVKGVIVTLYRMARVDMHPNLPVVDGSSGKLQKYEDYYPRSKTGLGGLSLSAAGSGQVWRKDLCQAFAPLFINPATMSTEVKAAVRVPDDSFPTFRNAPGDMISFRYFVEVVVDIHGKLAGQPSLAEDIDIPHAQTSMSANEDTTTYDEHHQVQKWTTNCVDTTPMRRDKNAISIVSDLIVGTKDSARGKDRSKRKDSNGNTSTMNSSLNTTSLRFNGSAHNQDNHQRLQYTGRHYSEPLHTDSLHPYDYGDQNDYYGYDEEYDYTSDPGYWHDPHYHQGYGANPYASPNGYAPPGGHAGWPAWPPPPPMPPPPAEEGLSEKERLRRMEESLLPSAPPVANGASSAAHNAPSAPFIPDENQFEDAQAFRNAVAGQRSTQAQLPSSSSSRAPAHPPESDFMGDMPSQPVPTYTPAPGIDAPEQRSPLLPETSAAVSAHQSDPKEPSTARTTTLASQAEGAARPTPSDGAPPSEGPTPDASASRAPAEELGHQETRQLAEG